MVCSDPRCLVCTEWERVEAGYTDIATPTWTESIRTIRRASR